MRKLFMILQYPRAFAADILYSKLRDAKWGGSLSEVIDKDMQRYRSKKSDFEGVRLLNELLLTNKVFRTQFYYRISKNEHLQSNILLTVSRIILPPLDNVEIGVFRSDCIGGGLKIMHKAGCVFSPYEAGENITVFQGVTVGASRFINAEGHNTPVIGNNVTLYANSVVAGGIKVGDNVTIGAGSVVLKDVPSNCVVAGNPAYIIRQDGNRVNIKL